MYNFSYFIILFFTASILLAGWVYFRRYRINRPPIGVFNMKDILFLMCFIIIMPFFYVFLPTGIIVGSLVLLSLSSIYFALEPILSKNLLIWIVTCALIVIDCVVAYFLGTKNNIFFFVNNSILFIVIVSITNVWAQGGMKAKYIAILGLFLTVYDFIATSLFSLTNSLFIRLSDLPFAPLVSWMSDGYIRSVGLGDLLLATVTPLVMRKAFGRTAGLIAWLLSFLTIAILFSLPLRGTFPVMIVLGPLIALQYGYWMRRRKKERTTVQYLKEEPILFV